MAQGSRQVQTQAQQQIQTLSPQQILVVKLLELPAVELEDRVRAELLENPALEPFHQSRIAGWSLPFLFTRYPFVFRYLNSSLSGDTNGLTHNITLNPMA